MKNLVRTLLSAVLVGVAVSAAILVAVLVSMLERYSKDLNEVIATAQYIVLFICGGSLSVGCLIRLYSKSRIILE